MEVWFCRNAPHQAGQGLGSLVLIQGVVTASDSGVSP